MDNGTEINLEEVLTFENRSFICVSEELKEHYDKILEARDEVLNDPEATGSHKASILNTTTAALKELVSLQKEAYNADLNYKIIQAVVSALESESPEAKKRVLAAIEHHLEGI